MFKRIDHIELVTAEPRRAIAFYTGVLGFTLHSQLRVAGTPLGPLDLAYLDLGGTTVELLSYPEGRPDARPRCGSFARPATQAPARRSASATRCW